MPSVIGVRLEYFERAESHETSLSPQAPATSLGTVSNQFIAAKCRRRVILRMRKSNSIRFRQSRVPLLRF
jgi:hypothetical protein